MSNKERRSTAPNAAELKRTEVIADLGGQTEDKSFIAFGHRRCNSKKGRKRGMSCAFKDFGFKGKENILVIGNMEVGERAAGEL